MIKIATFFCLLTISFTATAYSINADYAKIEFVDQPFLRTHVAFLIGEFDIEGSARMGSLVLYKRITGQADKVVTKILIGLRTRSAGASIYAGGDKDNQITLNRIQGKRLSDFYGMYSGVQAGAALLGGGGGVLAVNQNGIILRNLYGSFGVGFDFSIPLIELMPIDNGYINFVIE